MKKVLNYLLLISFIITNLVPITGIAVHKLASVVFLLLCVIHTVVYRRRMQWKRWVLLGTIAISFLSGLFGMILDEIPLVLALHKVVSIVCVFVLAIHIFVFHKRLNTRNRGRNA